MYGYKYLVIPVMAPSQTEVEVYLPKGVDWQRWGEEEVHSGGQALVVPCPLDRMPVFVKV